MKYWLRISLMVVFTIISGLLGLIIGALIGGNFAQEFRFNGVQGYEAAGQLGFFLGIAVGMITSWIINRGNQKSASN